MVQIRPPLPPMGRAPTFHEEGMYRSQFPRLGPFTVTGTEDRTYNCVAWTLGISDEFIWPSHSGTVTTIDVFDAFYIGQGFAPISPLLTTASMSGIEDADASPAIALYAIDGDCTHVALATRFPTWWESKLGAGLRVTHLLPDLCGLMYGGVVRLYQHVGRQEGIAVALEPMTWGGILATQIDHSNEAFEAFAAAYERWKRRITLPDIALQSNPQRYTNIPEFDAIVHLGEPVMPYIVNELSAGQVLLNAAMERITKLSPPPTLVGERRKSQWWLDWWKSRTLHVV